MTLCPRFGDFSCYRWLVLALFALVSIVIVLDVFHFPFIIHMSLVSLFEMFILPTYSTLSRASGLLPFLRRQPNAVQPRFDLLVLG